MIPQDDFTPHGYLDNPFHSWKLNPSGVLRSIVPLGMGWHVPNLGSYARNQFQYTAHLGVGLKVGKQILLTAEDFRRHKCSIASHLHTRNRFEYTCLVPAYELELRVRYFLVNEHALGCVIRLKTEAKKPLPVTCYLLHRHTHNPHTSRLWEHGLYVGVGPQKGSALLGIASEGDAFVHGARSADGAELIFGAIGHVVALEDAAIWAHDIPVARPDVTEHEESTGWQSRTVIVPWQLVMEGKGSERIVNAVLARGVSPDQSSQRWLDAMEEIARAEAEHHSDDQQFWSSAPQLTGDWPAHWRRGLVYDFETLRMMVRPSAGVLPHPWDAMQIQAPRSVLAEAAMDMLFLSYADPVLAQEVLLGHFSSSPRPNLPCMREDGSYNMIADDGKICGTAPEWGFPLWCCDQIFLRTADRSWLRRLYPGVAAYLRWWLAERRDPEGWLVYACSWESGQDVSRRFGPQQTGGTIIQHVRPVDLQASMAQGASILVRWARLLAQEPQAPANDELPALDFAAEAEQWKSVATEFTEKTRFMWQDGWFRDYDAVTREWSTLQDTMHLAPIFCGAASEEQTEQLRSYFAQPPAHSGWMPLSWPPVVMALVGAAAKAKMPAEAAELAYQFIEAAYRSTDSRELDEQGGLPGVTREYHQAQRVGKWGALEYSNAGIEGYGWGALSIHLLIRYLLGLRAQEDGQLVVAPMLPTALRREGANYQVGPLRWGEYILHVSCQVRTKQGFSLEIRYERFISEESLALDVANLDATIEAIAAAQKVQPQRWQWNGVWGEEQTVPLS
ncbi:MGH1-like glycoside hydrolase domain-containing protein [Ktedonosporobacter rubrisoli]|nr:trehalase family glycosidase [Ktedonosporobacter rubrisoli]